MVFKWVIYSHGICQKKNCHVSKFCQSKIWALDGGPNRFKRKRSEELVSISFFVRPKSYFDLNFLSGAPTNKVLTKKFEMITR